MTSATTVSGATASRPPAARDRRPRITHRPALDGLRGLAVVGVLLFHGGLLTGGYLGVDLFFVLSAYLITALLLVEARDTRRIDLGQFWLRRARRLLPAILGLLVVVALFGRFLADPAQWPSIRNQGIATLFYVANWQTIVAGTAYGAGVAGRSPLEHTWSLAIEEQFYLVWPLVVLGLLAIRRTPRMILWGAAVVAALGTASLIGLSFTDVSRNALYLSTVTRIGAIGFGALVASWQATREGKPMSTGAARLLRTGALAAGAVLMVAWATIDLNDTLLYRGGLTLCGIAVALVIWAVTEPEPGLLGRILSVRVLRGLGFISYGLYLWHWPIFLWLDEARTGLDGWALFSVRCLVSIAFAVVSYEYLEQPIRTSGWNAPKMACFGAAGAVVVVISLVVMAIGAPSNGLEGADEGPVLTATAGGVPLVAIYGDSVAYLFGKEGLAPSAAKLDISALDVGRIGCAPLGGITAARYPNGDPVGANSWTNCIDTLPTYPETLADRPDVSIVLFGGAQWDAKIDGAWRHPCDPQYKQLYRTRVTAAVARAGAGGGPVVVARPAPVIAKQVTSTTGLDDGAERANCLWDALAPLLGRPGLSTIDLRDPTCRDDDHCDEEGDVVAARSDGIHYTGEGALSLAPWFVREVLKAAGS